MLTMTKPTTPHPMSAGHRHADGTKRRNRAPKPRAAGANVLWKRLTDNVDDLVIKTAKNPELVSEVSRMVLFGHLSKPEGAAARRYAEIVGFRDRHMGITKRHIASPSYERGFGGEDQELERHAVEGTTKEYERKAKKAKKDFEKLDQLVQASGARDLVETVCLFDRRVNETHYRRLALVLRMMAYRLGILTVAEGKSTEESKPVERRDAKTVAEAAVETLENCFTKANRLKIKTFWIGAMPGIERSIAAQVQHDSVNVEVHTIRVKISGMVPGELDAQLLRAAEAKGWKEKA